MLILDTDLLSLVERKSLEAIILAKNLDMFSSSEI